MKRIYKYDPEHDCLREVARMEEPIAYCIGATLYVTAIDLAKNRLAWHAYKLHLASLRVIPCSPVSKWPEGELEEREDFAVIEGEACPRIHDIAFPITKQPRLYTQEEALEIWEESERQAILSTLDVSELKGRTILTKQQYFKTRFNVEL